MKKITLTKDDLLVKFYAFLGGHQNEDALQRIRIFNYDSCSLIRRLIFTTVFATLGLLVVFAVSTFLAAGVYINIFMIYLGVYDFSLLNPLEVGAVLIVRLIVSVALLIGLSAVLLNYVFPFLRKTTGAFLDFICYKIEERKKNREAKYGQVEPSSLILLYRSWKEKYCIKFEIERDYRN